MSYWQTITENRALDEVETGLFIGSMDARLCVEQRGIGAVVACLTAEEHAALKPLPVGVVEHHVLMDDTTSFEHDALHSLVVDATSFIRTQIAEGRNVLVHCAAGISRSATVVLAYLMLRDSISFPEALQRVREARPRVRPNARFEQYLRGQC